MNGLDAQKQYADSIQRVTKSGLLKIVTHFVSVRSEPSVTPIRFRTRFEADLSNNGISQEWAAHLKFHITPSIVHQPWAFAEVLRRESAGTVIDYYEAFVILCKMAMAVGQGEVQSVLNKEISHVHAQTGDLRLGAILAGVGQSLTSLPLAHPSTIRAAELILKGDYPRGVVEAMAYLSIDPADADALLLASRATAMLPSRTDNAERSLNLGQRIVSWMAGLTAKDASASKDFLEILKISFNFFGEPWANAVLGMARQETSEEPVSIKGDPTHLAALGIPSVHPFRVLWIPEKEAQSKYAQHAATVFERSSAGPYARAIVSGQYQELPSEEIVWEERVLLGAVQFFNSGEFSNALALADQLEGSLHVYYKRRAVRLACMSLLRLEKMGQCIDRLTTAYIQDRSAHDLLPIRSAARVFVANQDRTMAGNLSIPIFFEMYTRHVSSQHDSECMFACIEFLDSCGVQRPSELKHSLDRFDLKKLIYFLRYVCVESIMDRSSMFDSSRELLEERLTICRLLIELDADGVDAYHTEIKTLLRRLMLQKRMKEVEQSKIFVDTDSIKRTVAEDLRESFSRYIALRSERTDPGSSQEVEEALKKASTGDIDIKELFKLLLPKNETSDLFESIVRRLRDEYLLSPEHGLDKYLSVRIRHGTLAAHLRKPVELVKLITLREVGTGEYKKNEHWLKRIKTISNSVSEQISNRLGVFSKEFDRLVDDVKACIQIRKTPDGAGFFELPLPETQLQILSEWITSETTFEYFVDQILEWFGAVLDSRLVSIREYVVRTVKTRASDLLDQLSADIEKLNDVADIGELTNAIRIAKTDLRVAFDRVAAWFRRARIVANEPFPLEDAIYISAETVRTVAADFQPDVQILHRKIN